LQDRQDRKEQFLKDFEAEKKKRNKIILAVTSLVTVMAIAFFVYINNRPYESANGGNYNIGESANYDGKKVEMTDIGNPIVEEGKVKIPIQKIKENSIVYLEYEGDPDHVYYGKLKGVLPLTAFVSTSGRLILSTAVCEPCYGTKFYLENKELVCVACGTRWRSSDMQGVGGGCYEYPPEELKYTVEGDYIVVPEDEVKNWTPRFYEDTVMS